MTCQLTLDKSTHGATMLSSNVRHYPCMCSTPGTVLSQYPSIAPAISPREFALIGAAAFSTGVTRAVSTTVIVYELCGHKHIHLPLSGNEVANTIQYINMLLKMCESHVI